MKNRQFPELNDSSQFVNELLRLEREEGAYVDYELNDQGQLIRTFFQFHRQREWYQVSDF